MPLPAGPLFSIVTPSPIRVLIPEPVSAPKMIVLFEKLPVILPPEELLSISAVRA